MNARRLAIMRLLDARRKFTARELAERFGVSVRTIQRDLDRLQELGFPLYTEVGAGGGYRVLPNRILPPLQLTQQEALGLFLMLEWLEQVDDYPLGSVRARLADQYYGSLPPDVQDQIARLRSHLAMVVHEVPDGLSRAAYTTELLLAAVDQSAVRFVYEASAGPKVVEAVPLGIYYERGRWYMPAMTPGERVLLYRVDRVSELEVLEEQGSFSVSKVPTLREWLIAADEREGLPMRVRFTALGARMAETDPLFRGIEGGEWRGSVPEAEVSFTARRLLAYGGEAEVLEPEQLRSKVVELLAQALRTYGGQAGLE